MIWAVCKEVCTYGSKGAFTNLPNILCGLDCFLQGKVSFQTPLIRQPIPLFISYQNIILVFGQNPLYLRQIQSYIFEFLLIRGVHTISCTKPSYVYDGFTFLSGFFYLGPGRTFKTKVSKATLHIHKRVLKVIVKSSIIIPPSSLIRKLNKQVRQAYYSMFSLFTG